MRLRTDACGIRSERDEPGRYVPWQDARFLLLDEPTSMLGTRRRSTDAELSCFVRGQPDKLMFGRTPFAKRLPLRRLLFQPLQLFGSSLFKHLRLRHHLTPPDPILSNWLKLASSLHNRAHGKIISPSTSNGRTNPNSTSSSHTYVFLASRAGSEILYYSPWFGECPTLVVFEPLQLGEDVSQRSAFVPVHRSTRQ